jgi:hypothetical protein
MVYSNIEYGGDKPYNNFRISNSTARAPELRCLLYGFLLRCFLWVLVALFVWVLVALFFYGFLLRCFFMGSCCAVFLWVLVVQSLVFSVVFSRSLLIFISFLFCCSTSNEAFC